MGERGTLARRSDATTGRIRIWDRIAAPIILVFATAVWVPQASAADRGNEESAPPIAEADVIREIGALTSLRDYGSLYAILRGIELSEGAARGRLTGLLDQAVVDLIDREARRRGTVVIGRDAGSDSRPQSEGASGPTVFRSAAEVRAMIDGSEFSGALDVRLAQAQPLFMAAQQVKDPDERVRLETMIAERLRAPHPDPRGAADPKTTQEPSVEDAPEEEVNLVEAPE